MHIRPNANLLLEVGEVPGQLRMEPTELSMETLKSWKSTTTPHIAHSLNKDKCSITHRTSSYHYITRSEEHPNIPTHFVIMTMCIALKFTGTFLGTTVWPQQHPRPGIHRRHLMTDESWPPHQVQLRPALLQFFSNLGNREVYYKRII